MLRATGLDHVVLNVADARRSLAWWQEMLGAEPLRLEEWEAGQVPFVSVRLDAGTIIDLFETDRTGVNVDHLCVVVEGADLAEVAASGDFDVVRPPGPLFGARGTGTGMYVRDPDGNHVELRTYP
jgi:catechol 2,3-dioxygenase-like lactoylglutathione lyase family enzyme